MGSNLGGGIKTEGGWGPSLFLDIQHKEPVLPTHYIFLYSSNSSSSANEKRTKPGAFWEG